MAARNTQFLFDLNNDRLNKSDVRNIMILSSLYKNNKLNDKILSGVVAALIFLEPSSRTRFGFASAITKLGGSFIDLYGVKFQHGMTMEESIEDTIQSIMSYCDISILRGISDLSVFNKLFNLSDSSIINAGIPMVSHPTQALIDFFTIIDLVKSLDGIRIGFCGNLSVSRCFKSLLTLISRESGLSEIRIMSPEPGILELPSHTQLTIYNSLNFQDLDILYMAGYPNPHHKDNVERNRLEFSLTKTHAETFPMSCSILCPLPRIDEIDTAFDTHPSSRYFQQSTNGLYVRMSVLHYLMQRQGFTQNG